MVIMLIELNVIVDVYDAPINEESLPTLIKKGVIYKKTFNTETTTVEQFINDRGVILKSYSNVITNGQAYKVKHPYEYVYNTLKPIQIKGLLQYGKKSNNKS